MAGTNKTKVEVLDEKVEVFLLRPVQIESGKESISGTQTLNHELAKELIDSGIAIDTRESEAGESEASETEEK